MSVKIGTLDLKKAYGGATPLTALYMGTTKIWSAIPPPFNDTTWSQLDAWIDASAIPDGAVSSVVDLSQYNRVFTKSGTTITKANNRLEISAAALISSDYNPGNNGGISMVAVQTRTAATDGASYPMIWVYNATPAGRGYEVRYGGAGVNPIQMVADYTSGGPASTMGFTCTQNVPVLLWGEFKVAPSSPYTRLIVNGTVTGTVGGLTAMPGTAGNLSMGKRDDGYWFSGHIYEAMVFRGVLSDTDRQQIEGYLRTKWGLP